VYDYNLLYDIIKLLKDLGCNVESKTNDKDEYTHLTLFQKWSKTDYCVMTHEQKNKIASLLSTK
jgi:hypothetical protein